MDNEHFLRQLQEYFDNMTPEQEKENEEFFKEWANVGPTVDEYLKFMGFDD